MKTFVDRNEHIFDFITEMWVKCPKCGECAIIRNKDANSTDQFAERRVTCTTCSYTDDWKERGMAFPWYSEPADPCFGYPLWLQKPCCGEILWAYNPLHLEFLERFVSATMRERQQDEKWGWRNNSLASRLPKWIQIKKNRESVLKAVRDLTSKAQRIEQGAAPNP